MSSGARAAPTRGTRWADITRGITARDTHVARADTTTDTSTRGDTGDVRRLNTRPGTRHGTAGLSTMPGTTRPGTTRPGTTRPATTALDTTTPDSTTPDTTTPDTTPDTTPATTLDTTPDTTRPATGTTRCVTTRSCPTSSFVPWPLPGTPAGWRARK